MKKISQSWREGRYLDLWTVVHLFAGLMVGIGGLFLNISFWKSFVIGVIVFSVWEFFEHLRGITESLENRVIDVVIALIGIFLIFSFVSFAPQSVEFLLLSASIFVVYVGLAIRGWFAFLKRTGKKPPHNVSELYEAVEVPKMKEEVKKKISSL